jgi:hypothetical protein
MRGWSSHRIEPGLRDLRAGEEVLLLTWLDRADRETLSVLARPDGCYSYSTNS